MNGHPVHLDHLPTQAAGLRAPGWWGILITLMIESVFFVSAITGYFYLRAFNETWPPPGIEPPGLLLSAIAMVMLLASSGALFWAERSIKRGHPMTMRLSLAAGFVLGALFFGIKLFEYWTLPYDWTTFAYGSAVFALVGFHLTHVLAMVLANGAVQALAWQGYFNQRRYLAVQLLALFWHFGVAVWIPLYATIYWAPRLL